MDRKSIIPGLVGVAVLFVLTTGLALEHQTRRELSQEHQALQKQLDRVADLLAENERQASLPATANPADPAPNDPSTELLRLRTEIEALRQLTNEWERARTENMEAHAALDRYLAGEASPKVATADFWPRDSWSFAGFGNPDDALRSSLWASNNGNLNVLLDSVTGEFRQMLEKEFEGKSPDEAAVSAMDEVSNLKSVKVLSRDLQSDGSVVLTAAFEDRDQPHTTKLVLKKVGNDWKLAGVTGN